MFFPFEAPPRILWSEGGTLDREAAPLSSTQDACDPRKGVRSQEGRAIPGRARDPRKGVRSQEGRAIPGRARDPRKARDPSGSLARHLADLERNSDLLCFAAI